MSDYWVAFDESFRFEELIAALRLPDYSDDPDGGPGAGPEDWEARTAVLAFINALTNCPESLEDRIFLRDEFSRRGLNEVIVVRGLIIQPRILGLNDRVDASVHPASRFCRDPD